MRIDFVDVRAIAVIVRNRDRARKVRCVLLFFKFDDGRWVEVGAAERNVDVKRRAAADLTVSDDIAAVQLGDLFHERQA